MSGNTRRARIFALCTTPRLPQPEGRQQRRSRHQRHRPVYPTGICRINRAGHQRDASGRDPTRDRGIKRLRRPSLRLGVSVFSWLPC
jgi:hypothetical protein